MIQSKRTLEKSATLFKIQQFGTVIDFEKQSLQWIKTKNTDDFCLEYLCGWSNGRVENIDFVIMKATLMEAKSIF